MLVPGFLLQKGLIFSAWCIFFNTLPLPLRSAPVVPLLPARRSISRIENKFREMTTAIPAAPSIRNVLVCLLLFGKDKHVVELNGLDFAALRC